MAMRERMRVSDKVDTGGARFRAGEQEQIHVLVRIHTS